MDNENQLYQLRTNIVEKILGLGINPEFKNNPAFASAIARIDGLIAQKILINPELAKVNEEERKITIEYETQDEKHSISISSPDPNTFKGVFYSTDKKFKRRPDTSLYKNKVANEIIVSLEGREIKLLRNYSMVNSSNPESKEISNITGAEMRLYTSDGIMYRSEELSFGNTVLDTRIDDADPNSMLYIPRTAFPSPLFKWESKTTLDRNTLDTFRYRVEDKDGVKYCAVLPMDQQHGLREMDYIYGYYPENIQISPISLQEIDHMINKEKNPIVREGLKKYAKGRENYHYDSNNDPEFICNVNNDNEEKKHR